MFPASFLVEGQIAIVVFGDAKIVCYGAALALCFAHHGRIHRPARSGYLPMPDGKEKDDFLTAPLKDAKRTTPHRPPPASGETPPELPAGSLHALRQRYDILAEVGHGGMGIVYKARDRETDAIVALKVLRPEIAADTAVIERFKSELLLARKITHKNVCRIYELLRFGDAAVISMEYIEGESLREFLTRYRGVPLRKGVEWASQICHALSEAHSQGIVHRDLKPENIVIDRDGNVKVMDFGIARSLETTTSTTGMMVGTPAYMAPEQAESKPTDTRSDIYSLGLVFYEMFTGQCAFRANTPVGLALKQIHDTPPAPREVEPTLPEHIEKAILKCLEKNPAKRFQSVDELEVALTQETQAKPAAVESEGAEVALPISLATWRRSDWFLLASGILGAAVFFLLFYRFHPAAASVVETDAQQVRQITAGALKKLQWDVEIERPEPYFSATRYYFARASNAGSWADQNRWLHLEGLGIWNGKFRKSEGEEKGLEGHYWTDIHGRLRTLYSFRPDTVFHAPQGSAPDEASTARMKEIAQTAIKTLFGEDLSATKALASAFWYSPGQSWRVGFSWELPQQPQGFVTKVDVNVEGSRLVYLSHRTGDEPSEQFHKFYQTAQQAYAPPGRYSLSGLTMLVLVFVLFLARRLYREARSPQILRLAILVGFAGAVAISPFVVWPAVGPPRDSPITIAVVFEALTFSVLTLLSYAILTTVIYYLRRCFPVQAANYLQLFREHVFARTAGLEMLRGVFAGAAFGGVWMVFVSLATVWSKAAVGMVSWLGSYNPLGGFRVASGAGFFQVLLQDPLWPFHARVFPLLLIGEVLFIAWLLVALPLSLLSRATTRWPVLLAALSALWMALGFSLAGAMVFPTLPYYIFVVLQAVFCGAVFLRYGLLATLSAVFTIEVGLLAFPFLEIFQNVDPLPFAIPVVLWFLLLLAAAGLYFRPHVTGAYRRVVAVFE
jgi:predicted Ser/Thr protein kinase